MRLSFLQLCLETAFIHCLGQWDPAQAGCFFMVNVSPEGDVEGAVPCSCCAVQSGFPPPGLQQELLASMDVLLQLLQDFVLHVRRTKRLVQ